MFDFPHKRSQGSTVQKFLVFATFMFPALFPQVCYDNPTQRSRFIRCVYNMLNSTSSAVRYDAAGVLVTLSSAPTAVKVGVAVSVAVCMLVLLCLYDSPNIHMYIYVHTYVCTCCYCLLLLLLCICVSCML